ncbi:hypothetical protein F5B19DRAFT_480663 [Rostrohypoxylon terebratum]|nr:hypothetical protein F5B19DRAFT_480663 [Rostrohypoxylon terebratum]
MHKLLLREHYDFLLASQHPPASPALRQMASKHDMPGRLWYYGIYSLLELLRKRLPHSRQHIIIFIYLAYTMISHLYEDVAVGFKDIWAEHLGDLARYRMGIEVFDIRVKIHWMSMCRNWYSKASNGEPNTGRLYHRLATMAQENPSQQLYYYTKSLCVASPFPSTRQSIMTLFDQHSRLSPIDRAFVKAHSILFSKKFSDDFSSTVDEFCANLDNHIARTARKWMESGYYIAISNCCGILFYSQEDNVILKEICPQRYTPSRIEEGAHRLFIGTCSVVFRRISDFNILPFLHVVMVFIFHFTHHLSARSFIENIIPWKLLSLQLNSHLRSRRSYCQIEDEKFPRQSPRPLPEDFAVRGLGWDEKYFPVDWFPDDVDDDEKYSEVASMTNHRKERILWLGVRIAMRRKCPVTYNEKLHEFGVVPEYEEAADIVTDGSQLARPIENIALKMGDGNTVNADVALTLKLVIR